MQITILPMSNYSRVGHLDSASSSACFTSHLLLSEQCVEDESNQTIFLIVAFRVLGGLRLRMC